MNQNGFLSIVTIILIVIIGFLGIAITYMIYGSAFATIHFSQSEKALYIAEGGLEKANRYLLTPVLSGSAARIACSALPANANLTNSSLEAGTFTVTTVSGSPYYLNTTLSGSINNTSTTIAVASTAGFAASGRILIDKEAINYSSLSGNNFVGVIRGSNGTLATSHSSGTPVSQYQCSLNSAAGIPNLTSSVVKRTVQQTLQLQDGWAVGARSGNNFVVTHWNQPAEIQWNNASFLDATNRENLNAVSVLSNADGWAVGDERSNRFTFLRLVGSNWLAAPIANACNGQHLNGVSTVSNREAWAVGQRYRPGCAGSGNFRYDIMYWNGSTWNLLSSATSPSIPADGSTSQIQHLNAVHVIDTNGSGVGNLGFAVGINGQILQYNGSQWIAVASGTNRDLNGVFVVSATEAWAVGNSGTILRWNGSAWGAFGSPTSRQLNGIFMLDTVGTGTATIGWIVGNSGLIATYDGSTWSSQDIGSNNLRAVAGFNSKDVWAVGGGGNIFHWDGNSWSEEISNVTTLLNGIALVNPGRVPFAEWQEVFN